jgi:hypothetical protein
MVYDPDVVICCNGLHVIPTPAQISKFITLVLVKTKLLSHKKDKLSNSLQRLKSIMASTGTRQCQTELTEAFICTQVLGPAECDCFDPAAFTTAFEQQTRESFLGTQAFVSTVDPSFCSLANDQVCDYYEMNQSCCCQYETEQYRKCLFETVLVNELQAPLAEPCKNTCAMNGSGGGGGGDSTTLIVAVAAVVVVIALAGGGYFYCRRRRQKTTRSAEKQVTENKGFSFWHAKDGKNATTENKGNGKIDDAHDNTSEEDIERAVSSDSASSSYSDDSDSKKTSSKPVINRNIVYEESKPVAKMIPSKAHSESRNEDQDDDKDAACKASQLKKKRHAIETWNSEKKHGSNRSLQSYIS